MMEPNDPIDLDKERRLNRAIESLAFEQSTNRDLWPEIAQRIKAESASSEPMLSEMKEIETKSSNSRWINWAVAASLVLCVGSLSFSWHQLEKAEAIYAQLGQLKDKFVKAETPNDLNSGQIKRVSFHQPGEPVDLEYIRQVESMETEFKVAKARLMARISMNRHQIDAQLFNQIETDLLEIQRASAVLKSAMGTQVANTKFMDLLRMTYEQELTVLTQLARLDSTI